MEKIILLSIAVLGIMVALNYFISLKRGEPTSDEFSKHLLQKSSSSAFYVSLYFWLFISSFSDKLAIETGQLINYGIIGMAFIFVLSWATFKIIGIKNA